MNLCPLLDDSKVNHLLGAHRALIECPGGRLTTLCQSNPRSRGWSWLAKCRQFGYCSFSSLKKSSTCNLPLRGWTNGQYPPDCMWSLTALSRPSDLQIIHLPYGETRILSGKDLPTNAWCKGRHSYPTEPTQHPSGQASFLGALAYSLSAPWMRLTRHCISTHHLQN